MVGRALRELALVEHVVGGEQSLAQRPVDLLGAVARPAGVADTVLVHDERDSSPPCEPEERAEVAWEPGGAEVEERERVRGVREALGELLHLRRASGRSLARRRHAIVA